MNSSDCLRLVVSVHRQSRQETTFPPNTHSAPRKNLHTCMCVISQNSSSPANGSFVVTPRQTSYGLQEMFLEVRDLSKRDDISPSDFVVNHL